MAPAASVDPSGSSTNLVQASHTSTPSENRAVESLISELREEMQMELKRELRRDWYASMKDTFSWKSRLSWTGEITGDILPIDGSPSSHQIYPSRRLLSFCNKPTVLYWTYSAQVDHFIWACIDKEWFRCYNQAPKLDLEHFFAIPVCITSSGPRTIPELLEIQESFYNQTSSLLDSLRQDENEKAYMDASPYQHKLLPLCRAIIVVLDELVPCLRERLNIYLGLEVQGQNAVMVRTGKEAGLSSPISFASIREEALPLARPDLETHNDIDAIRVPLATAVQFIVNLQQREEAAFPDLAPSTAGQQSLCPPINRHTESRAAKTMITMNGTTVLMDSADEKGIDKVSDAREAMRAAILTVQAAQRGEDPT